MPSKYEIKLASNMLENVIEIQDNKINYLYNIYKDTNENKHFANSFFQRVLNKVLKENKDDRRHN